MSAGKELVTVAHTVCDFKVATKLLNKQLCIRVNE